MKVYVHDVGTNSGRAIYDAVQAQGVEVTTKQDSLDSKSAEPVQPLIGNAVDDQPTPADVLPDVAEAVAEQPADFVQPPLSAESSELLDIEEPNVFVYQLSLEAASIHATLQALARQKQSHAEQVFIAVTTPLTWARTALASNAAMPAEQSEHSQPLASNEAADVIADANTSLPNSSASEQPGVADQPETASAALQLLSLTGADADRRRAAACARSVLEAERTILAAATKTFKTYVICPGVLYGDGESAEGLHSLFRTAWEAQPGSPVPLFGNGQNIIPTIHAADLAAYVAAVCIEPPAQQYLLAVDDAQLTQRDVVAAVAQKMGGTPVKELGLEELYFQQGIEHMLMHLPMTCSPLETPPILQYADGLIAHLDTVVQQYIEGHSLQPLRVMLTGPPAAGKSSLAARLAQHYQLQVVSAKTILAAADELGGSTKQEVQTEMGSKVGRVSDANMVKLCNHVLSKRDMRMRGFLLEGWPKTPEQAQLLFTQDQPYTPEERQRLEALRDGQAGVTAAAAAPTPTKGKPAKPDPKGGKAPLRPDLPKRFNPLPGLFPTHVIHLEAPEASLLPRCLALGEQELAAAKAAAAAAAAADGKPAGAPAKGKAKEPAGPMTHNTEKDFKRRYAAYKAGHEGDAASLKASQVAEQLWWDDTRILLEAAATAEADAAAAASAKTLRLTALASMKSMGTGGVGALLGNPSRHGSLFLTARSRTPGVTSLMPGGAASNSRKGSPALALPAAAARDAHMEAGVPQLQHGGLLGLFAKHHAQVLVLDTNQPTGSDGVFSSVTALVGAPHNYSASESSPTTNQLAEASRPVPATTAVTAVAGDAVEHAAVESLPAQLAADQAAQDEYILRARGETVAMRAEPLKGLLMQQLMPVLAKALVEATEEQAADPVQFVAHKLLQAGKLLDLQYEDPYAADVYDTQQQKWDAKQQREADKKALIAARAASVTA